MSKDAFCFPPDRRLENKKVKHENAKLRWALSKGNIAELESKGVLAFTGAGAKQPSGRSRAMALERAKAEQEIAHFQRELDKANRLADDLALRLKQQADDHGRAISARQRDSDKILEVCILALLCAHFDMHARIGNFAHILVTSHRMLMFTWFISILLRRLCKRLRNTGRRSLRKSWSAPGGSSSF